MVKYPWEEGAIPVQTKGQEYYRDMFACAGGQTIDENRYVRKAFTSGTAGSGSEFVPATTSASIIKFVYLDSWARQLFGTVMMGPGLTTTFPKFSSDFSPENPADYTTEVTTALGSSPASIAEGDPSTTSVTLTIKTLACNLQLQRKAINYSVSPRDVERELREQVAKQLQEREEDAFVNGDTTSGASNLNNAYNATNHPHGFTTAYNEWLGMWNGLRKSAAGTSVNVGSTISASNFATAIKNLGKYGVKPDKVVFLVSVDLHASMITMDEVETMEKYPNATIVSGQVRVLYGARVVVTDKLPSTFNNTLVNASGTRSSSLTTNTKTEALAVYIDTPIIGVPPNPSDALMIEDYRRPDLDRTHVIAREDIAFGVRYTDAIVRLINITP